MRAKYNVQWASKDLGFEARTTIGDVDRDGINEIITVANLENVKGSVIVIFKKSKNTVYEVSRLELSQDSNVVFVYDINMDGKNEIIVGTDRNILIFKLEDKRLVLLGESISLGGVITSISAKDVDKDGNVEILVTVKNKFYIFRWINRLVIINSLDFKGNIKVALGDVDNDKKIDIVVKEVNDSTGVLYIFKLKNNELRKLMAIAIRNLINGFLVVGDIDRDGKSEIVFNSKDDYIYVFKKVDKEFTFFRKGIVESKNLNDAVIFDIDNDGINEIITISLNSLLILEIHQRDIKIKLVQVIPNGAISVSAGELDNRSPGEIIIGTSYGYVYLLQTVRDEVEGNLLIGRVQSIIQDTVEIPAGKPDAARIVESKAKFIVDDVRVIEDKVIVDGEVEVKVLYVANLPSQPVHFFEDFIPFLQFIHLYGAHPGMEALVHFKTEYVDSKLISPRKVKVTVVFEMFVKLIKFY